MATGRLSIMVKIREAKYKDFPQLLNLFKALREKSPFKNKTFNEAAVQRSFVVAIHYGFSKVVEQDGEIVGSMFGTIGMNQWGMTCAYDQFTFTPIKTPQLLKLFKFWAKENGAEEVFITNIIGSERYNQLIQRLGFTTQSHTFSQGV